MVPHLCYLLPDEILDRFNHFNCPHYTHLLEEYLGGKEEATAGTQNNLISQLNINFNYKLLNLDLSLTMQNFINQKIITQAGGYSEQKQMDINFITSAKVNKPISKKITILPSIPYRLKDSNQAYLHFQTFPATHTVVSNYYDYHKISFSSPFILKTTLMTTLNVSNELDLTFYPAKPIRNENNEFIYTERQYVLPYLFNISYTIKHRMAPIALFYTYQKQISNMKFEKYFPYNYSGHHFGISLKFIY